MKDDSKQIKKDGKEKDFDFKKSFDELEEINRWFSGSDIDLNKALEQYRRGGHIIKEIKTHLKEVENEFKEIKDDLERE